MNLWGIVAGGLASEHTLTIAKSVLEKSGTPFASTVFYAFPAGSKASTAPSLPLGSQVMAAIIEVRASCE